MAKYIDAEKLIAEIERYQNTAIDAYDPLGEDAEFWQGKIVACEDLKTPINSFQQEQPGADALVKMIWHKESDHPNNKHPYPVINPDGEMAFAYYDGIYGWQFDRDFPHSVNMMWLDIEMILPVKDND